MINPSGSPEGVDGRLPLAADDVSVRITSIEKQLQPAAALQVLDDFGVIGQLEQSG
jgi:hypothetical protein